VIKASQKINPTQHEGFVVCDKHFNRVKVKAPQYVALAMLNVKDPKGMNFQNMLKIVRTYEGSEFLAYFPEFEELYSLTKTKYNNFLEDLENIYKKTVDNLEKKFGDTSNFSEDEFQKEFSKK